MQSRREDFLFFLEKISVSFHLYVEKNLNSALLNLSKKTSKAALDQANRINQYYQFQSKIYDWTRWSFLFGRLGILKQIPFSPEDKFTIAEIGCGTGFNLEYIAQKYVNADLIGVDVSEDMLDIARKKLLHFSNAKVFHHLPYSPQSSFLQPSPDLILFSYALTMINPQWQDLIEKAYDDLPVGGKIMVVDFYDSRFNFFKNHMGNHHVRMDGHILPELKKQFKPIQASVKSAYGGVWEYFLFVGEK